MYKQIQRNVLYSLIEAFCTTTILLVQYSLIAKHLSTQDFGIYSLGMLWSLIIIITSYSFSLPIILSRELCQRNQHKEIISNIFALQLLLGLVVLSIFIPVVLCSTYFKDFNNFGFIILITASLLCAAPISMQGILISQGKIPSVAGIKILAFLLNFLAIFFVINFNLGLSWIFASNLILVLVFTSGFFLLSGTKSYLDFQCLNIKEIKYSFIQASPVVLMSLTSQLYNKIDIIMVDIIKGKEQVAIYTSAYKLLEYLLIISTALIVAVSPNLMKLAGDIPRFKLFYKNMLKFGICCLFPLAIVIAVFAGSILEFIYGDTYSAAASTLQILMLAGCLSFLNAPSSTIFISFKKQKIFLVATILSLTVNIAGNYLLIPVYDYKGSAIATLATELFMFIFCSININKIMKLTQPNQ